MNGFSGNLGRNGNRMTQRAPVLIEASLTTMSAYQFPEVTDISPTGARLNGTPLPPKGTTALFKAGLLEVLCRVVWVKDDQCGIRFDEPVSLKLLKQVQLDGAAALEPFPKVA